MFTPPPTVEAKEAGPSWETVVIGFFVGAALALSLGALLSQEDVAQVTPVYVEIDDAGFVEVEPEPFAVSVTAEPIGKTASGEFSL